MYIVAIHQAPARALVLPFFRVSHGRMVIFSNVVPSLWSLKDLSKTTSEKQHYHSSSLLRPNLFRVVASTNVVSCVCCLQGRTHRRMAVNVASVTKFLRCFEQCSVFLVFFSKKETQDKMSGAAILPKSYHIRTHMGRDSYACVNISHM